MKAEWTIDPETGRCNSSKAYNDLCNVVESLIRNSAHHLIAGRADWVASLIVSQLAYKHHMAPQPAPTEGGDI